MVHHDTLQLQQQDLFSYFLNLIQFLVFVFFWDGGCREQGGYEGTGSGVRLGYMMWNSQRINTKFFLKNSYNLILTKTELRGAAQLNIKMYFTELWLWDSADPGMKTQADPWNRTEGPAQTQLNSDKNRWSNLMDKGESFQMKGGWTSKEKNGSPALTSKLTQGGWA